jgi:hypothetical protein
MINQCLMLKIKYLWNWRNNKDITLTLLFAFWSFLQWVWKKYPKCILDVSSFLFKKTEWFKKWNNNVKVLYEYKINKFRFAGLYFWFINNFIRSFLVIWCFAIANNKFKLNDQNKISQVSRKSNAGQFISSFFLQNNFLWSCLLQC